MSTHFEDPVAESSDYVFRGTIRDENGDPIDSSIVEAMTVHLRDVTSGEMLWGTEDGAGEDVLSALGTGGAIVLPIPASINRAVGEDEHQLRLLTFHITHSEGRMRNQEFTFYLDQMTDVPDEE